MIGKVKLAPAMCAGCGRDRLRLAYAPWGELSVVCAGCKSITPAADADLAAARVPPPALHAPDDPRTGPATVSAAQVASEPGAEIAAESAPGDGLTITQADLDDNQPKTRRRR